MVYRASYKIARTTQRNRVSGRKEGRKGKESKGKKEGRKGREGRLTNTYLIGKFMENHLKY